MANAIIGIYVFECGERAKHLYKYTYGDKIHKCTSWEDNNVHMMNTL